MTELDPSIILHASDGLAKIPTYDEIVAAKQKRDAAQQEIEVRTAAIAEHQRAIDEAARQLALQKQVGGMAASGDLEGADKTALGAGDFDLHGHIKGLQDEHRVALAHKAEAGAQVAYAAGQMPYEQRRAAIQQATPQLVNAGWTPEEIAAFDPTDQNINELVASTQSIKDALDQHEKAAALAETTRHNKAVEGRPVALAPGGVLVDVGGTTLGGAPGAPAGAPAGRYTGGWTPRHANGGDNSDAVVDSKISGMASALGISPTDDIRSISPVRIAQALALSEGGPGSLADRNNNPANLTDAKTGAYRKFPTKQAGIAAAAAQVARNIGRGQTTIQSMVEGLPTGGAGHGARVIAINPKSPSAPAGYRWNGGSLEAIPGGPASSVTLDQPTRALMADQYLAGDKSVLQNLGRGTQGAKNIVLLRQEIFSQAQQRGMSGADIAKAMAQFNGLTASARTIGNIGGKVDYGVNELLQSIPLAQRASQGLPRGQFVPVTRIQQMIQSGTSNPALKDFAIKTNAVINAYNLVAGRAGTDVEQRRHNAQLLITADSPEAYKAALAAMETEGKVAQAASRTTMEGIGNRPAPPKPGTVVKGYRFKGGNPANPSSWVKVQ